jgi:hypothetical protein
LETPLPRDAAEGGDAEWAKQVLFLSENTLVHNSKENT